MKYLFQIARILFFCLCGELLRLAIPLPIPAAVYGMILLFAALSAGLLRVADIRETAGFLIAILPVLFVTPAVGVMERAAEISALLVPIAIALIPITLLVMSATGLACQGLRRMSRAKKGGADV